MAEGIIVGVAVGAVMILINALVKRAGSQTQQSKAEDRAVQNGMKALLHYRIVAICDECTSRGYVRLHNLEAVETMYSAYHDLGGNGTITKCAEDFKKLPIR